MGGEKERSELTDLELITGDNRDTVFGQFNELSHLILDGGQDGYLAFDAGDGGKNLIGSITLTFAETDGEFFVGFRAFTDNWGRIDNGGTLLALLGEVLSGGNVVGLDLSQFFPD